MASTELIICLREQNVYYPGDRITGELLLDLKKPIDVLSICLHFIGYIEFLGNKIMLINETQSFAEPQPHKKYTSLTTEQIHRFEFLFTVPRDKHLPSTVALPKYGKVHYSLTATHKKPKLRLSHSLQPVSVEIKLLDMINVLLPQYRNPHKVSKDIGFVNGNKLTQWNLDISKTAFLPGEVIEMDCTITHFPDMNKGEAITISLVKQIQKPTSTKILDEQIILTEYIHIYIDQGYSSTQTIPVKLKIPNNTIPNIFPNVGRSLILSYVIRATLDLKGVKSAVKIQQNYEQQITVIVGTYPLAQSSITPNSSTTSSANVMPPLMRPAEFYTLSNSSIISTRSCSVATIDTASIISSRKNNTTPSHLNDIKPLSKLDVYDNKSAPRSYVAQRSSEYTERKPTRSYLSPSSNEMAIRKSYVNPNEPRESMPLKPYNPDEYSQSRSYLSPNSKEYTTGWQSPLSSPRIKPEKMTSGVNVSSRFHSSAPVSMERLGIHSATAPKKTPPVSVPTYQQEFDDYLPPEISKYDTDMSDIDKSTTTLSTLRQLSIKESNMTRQVDRNVHCPTNQPCDITEQSPHVNDSLMRNAAEMESYNHFDSNLLTDNEDSSPPGLVRHDTMSTASSNALSEVFNYNNTINETI